MAHIIIVPKTEVPIEDAVHLEYKEAHSLTIEELPEVTLVRFIDRHGDEQVFEDPKSYSFDEEED